MTEPDRLICHPGRAHRKSIRRVVTPIRPPP